LGDREDRKKSSKKNFNFAENPVYSLFSSLLSGEYECDPLFPSVGEAAQREHTLIPTIRIKTPPPTPTSRTAATGRQFFVVGESATHSYRANVYFKIIYC
jgi:hypothetical protein